MNGKPTDAPRRTWLLVLLLGTMAGISPMSLTIHVQSIPAIATALNADYMIVQLTVSLYLLTFASAQLVVGPLSDKFGRRPVLFCGLALFAVASAAAAIAPSIETLIAARVVQAIGGCTALVVPRAVVQDRFTGSEAARIMALMAMVQSAGPPIAPVIGGLIDAFIGWRAIFWALLAFAGMLALLAALWLPETPGRGRGVTVSWNEIFMRYAGLLRSRLYLGYTAVFTFGTTGFFAYLAAGPGLLINTRGVSPVGFSLLLTIIATQFVLGSFIASRLVRRFGVDRTLLFGAIGITLPAIVLVALSGSDSIAAVVAPVAAFALFNGFIFPNALAGAIAVDPRIAATAASFLGFAQLGTGAVLAFVISSLPTDTVLPLGIALVLFGLLTLWGIWLVHSAEREQA